jgi:hypothetical protein
MARITAERLVRHLERSGYVLMRRPPAAVHTTGGRPQRKGAPSQLVAELMHDV